MRQRVRVFRDAAEARALASPAGECIALRQWQAVAARHRTVIAGGFFCELRPDGRLFHSAALIDGSGLRAVYRKAHLWDAEKLVFTPGAEAPPVAELPVGRPAWRTFANRARVLVLRCLFVVEAGLTPWDLHIGGRFTPTLTSDGYGLRDMAQPGPDAARPRPLVHRGLHPAGKRG